MQWNICAPPYACMAFSSALRCWCITRVPGGVPPPGPPAQIKDTLVGVTRFYVPRLMHAWRFHVHVVTRALDSLISVGAHVEILMLLQSHKTNDYKRRFPLPCTDMYHLDFN